MGRKSDCAVGATVASNGMCMTQEELCSTFNKGYHPTSLNVTWKKTLIFINIRFFPACVWPPPSFHVKRLEASLQGLIYVRALATPKAYANSGKGWFSSSGRTETLYRICSVVMVNMKQPS